MICLLVAAPNSGSGKTVLTCALLAALKRRGRTPCAFKCGPDYIDPMFHRAVLGVESHNLDLFLSGETALRNLFSRCIAGHGAAVCEGAMGFYDGVRGITTQASAWHVADTLGLPVLLAVRPKGASLTLAAPIRGLQAFRSNNHIAAILLTDTSPALCKSLAPMLETETGLPVAGCLPHLPEACLESRHLGLRTAGEIENLPARMERLADALEANADLDRLFSLCTFDPPAAYQGTSRRRITKIAVARDAAFCFAYAETLEALEAAGAELLFFSPLTGGGLPDGTCGLYLPGGYPELYAEELSKNDAMRQAIRSAVENGLPTVAECGGFLYLGQTLEDPSGVSWAMAGVLPGAGVKTERLVRFGYHHLTAQRDGLLLRAGETVPVHEFHYWDSSANGDAFTSEKGALRWSCGYSGPGLHAAFPHLYFAGRPELAERFTAKAAAYGKEHGR